MDPLKVTPPEETKLHFLDYWRIIRIRKTIILAVFLLVVITATLVTFILPDDYASTARIKVESDAPPVAKQVADDPYVIQTAIEIIQSQVVLDLVVERLKLNVVWGKKFFNGETLRTNEAMAILKGWLEIAPVCNTNLVDITVYSADPKEAAQIANAVAECYRDYRVKTYSNLIAKGMAVLEQQYKTQADRVHGVESEVEALRQRLNVGGETNASPAPQGQPYWEKQQALSQMLDGHKLLRSKIEAGQLALQKPQTAFVQITETAKPGLVPVKPRMKMSLFVGLAAGVFLGLMAGVARVFCKFVTAKLRAMSLSRPSDNQGMNIDSASGSGLCRPPPHGATSALARPRRSLPKVFWGVSTVVFLLVVMASVAVTFILPEQYGSTARIQVKPDSLEPDNPALGSEAYDPHFIRTTIAVMESQLVLSNVIATLNLNVEWGKKFFNGETLKTRETMEILRGRIWLAPKTNTMLIWINSYNDDKKEAAMIANAIADAYQKFRWESIQAKLSSTLQAMERQYAQEQAQLQQVQAGIEELRQKIRPGSDSSANASPDEKLYADRRRHLDQILEAHNNLFSRIQAERLALEMPKTSLVQITDRAEPGREPVRPNKPVDIFLGVIKGAILGLLAGSGAVFFVHKYWNRWCEDCAATSGVEIEMPDDTSAPSNRPTSPLSAFFGVFITVFLLVLMSSVIITLSLPKSWASTARVKVKPDSLEPDYPVQGADAYDLPCIQTTLTNLQSPVVLSNVIAALNLNVEWGKKHFDLEALETSQLMEMLKARLRLAQMRNTMLVTITAYSDDRNEAAAIANAMAVGYKKFRLESLQATQSAALKAVEKQYADEETQIQQVQAGMDESRQKIRPGSDSPANPSPDEKDFADRKRNLDQILEAHKTRFAKMQAEKLALEMPKTSLVQITDPAEPGKAPVKPNKDKNMFLGAVAGVFLGLLAGSPFAFAYFKSRKRGRSNATSA